MLTRQGLLSQPPRDPTKKTISAPSCVQRAQRDMRSITAPAILLVCAVAAVGAVELTQENFASLAAGRTTFVKFYATWCGHCRAMKPSWDALMHEYKDDRHVLVGDCDCTGACAALCAEVGVKGYPTLRFGDPTALQDYTGGRDLDSLKAHIQTLGPRCSLDNMHLCHEEEKGEIEGMLAMSAEDLNALVADIEKEITSVESSRRSPGTTEQKTSSPQSGRSGPP